MVAEKSIDVPFVVLNADDHYGHEAFSAAYGALELRWQSRKGSYLLVSYELGTTLSPRGPVSRGICEMEGRKLTALTEYTHLQRNNGQAESLDQAAATTAFSLATPVSMNFWGFTPDLFSRLRPLLAKFARESSGKPDREFYLPDAIGKLVQIGNADVEVIPAGSEWFGMTYQSDHDVVCERIAGLIDAGVYPRQLWAS